MSEERRAIAANRDARIIAARPKPDTVDEFKPWLITRLQERAAGIKVKDIVVEIPGTEDPTVRVISCGSHADLAYVRRDGARCAFTFVIRQTNDDVSLVTYKFHVAAPETASAPAWLRYEFDLAGAHDPTFEPRSHFHPGHRHVRAPAPVLTPRELVAWFLDLQPWW